jgi:putative addiction module component (TIGR02574 family)
MITKELKENILSLDPLEKISLVEDILNTLDIPDPEIEKKWVEESERRYHAYRNGLVNGITLDEFEKRLKK